MENHKIERRNFIRDIVVGGGGIIALTGFTGLLSSCSKDSFVIPPKGQADFGTLTNSAGVNGLLIGAYAVTEGHISSNATRAWASSVSNWVWGGVASDDAFKGSGVNDQQPIIPIEFFYVDPSNTYVLYHYQTYLDGVTRANNVLKAVKLAKDISDSDKLQIEAQARFLRAHFYFQLTIVHGAVPYIDENTIDPSTVLNDHLVYPEMENDLKFASENLPSRWSDLGRVTEWAAKTYLAKVYMFEKKFADALPLLQDVYKNGGFSLMPSFEQNFRMDFDNNSESIWEIEYAVNDGGNNGSPNANQGDGLCMPFVFSSSVRSYFYVPTNSLVSSFRVTAEGLPYVGEAYSVNDILPYDPTGQTVPYKLPVDPRLDWSIGRPGIPFLNFGFIQKGDSTSAIDVINYGPYNNKKEIYWNGDQAYVTSSGWMNALNANNFRVFKLDTVILWLAECEVEVGSLDKATSLVNEIRNRAKGSNVVRFADGSPAANYLVEPYPTVFPSQEYGRDAVRRELQIEFAMEGMRFFDLVRWGIISDVMNNFFKVEGTVFSQVAGRQFTKGKNEIWPIPQTEIDITNSHGKKILSQNPGY